MRHFILVVSASLLALPLFGQEKSPQLKDWKDQYSYNIGMQLGSTLREKKDDINPDILAAGFKDAITLSDDQVKDVMAQLQKDMAQRQKELGEKNKTEGAKFLEENKKKPGVKTTASGLQYKVEKEGTGAQPKPTDIVTVNYHVSSIDGTEFDAYNAGRPTTLSGQRQHERMDEGGRESMGGSAAVDESRIKISGVRSVESCIWRTLHWGNRPQCDSDFRHRTAGR